MKTNSKKIRPLLVLDSYPHISRKVPVDTVENYAALNYDLVYFFPDLAARADKPSFSYLKLKENLKNLCESTYKLHNRKTLALDFGTISQLAIQDLFNSLDLSKFIVSVGPSMGVMEVILPALIENSSSSFMVKEHLDMETDAFEDLVSLKERLKNEIEKYQISSPTFDITSFIYENFGEKPWETLFDRINYYQVAITDNLQQFGKKYYIDLETNKDYTASQVFTKYFASQAPTIAEIYVETPEDLIVEAGCYPDAAGYMVPVKSIEHAKELASAFHELYPADKYDPPELR